MRAAKDGEEFITVDGYRLYTLLDLLLWLSYTSEESFKHHVNEERNDISSWIRDVFGLESLANKIELANNRKVMTMIIEDYIFREEATPIVKKDPEEALGDFLREVSQIL